jgi:hypothetical protein
MDLDPHGPAYDLTPETSANQKHCEKITIYILLNTLFFSIHSSCIYKDSVVFICVCSSAYLTKVLPN